jgi:hypothetical protein
MRLFLKFGFFGSLSRATAMSNGYANRKSPSWWSIAIISIKTTYVIGL